MQRLLLVFAPAFVVLILFAACGGGSSTTTTTTPAGATTAASATAAATTVATTAATTSGEATSSPAGSSTPASTDPTALPDLPPSTKAVSDFHVFPPAGGQGSILYTASITQAIPDGAPTFWYTYDSGQWQQLQPAYVTGLREQQAQGSFDVTPKNLVVLAVTS